MKPFVLLLVIVAFLNTISHAQNPIVNTRRAVGIDQTYNVAREANSHLFIVKNEKNKLADVQPTFPSSLGNLDPWAVLYRTNKLDHDKLYADIAGAFSSRQLAELKNERLNLLLYFSDSGDLLEVIFGLPPESKLSVGQINSIETRLKKNLKLKILANDMKGSSFLQYNKTVYFRDLQVKK